MDEFSKISPTNVPAQGGDRREEGNVGDTFDANDFRGRGGVVAVLSDEWKEDDRECISPTSFHQHHPVIGGGGLDGCEAKNHASDDFSSSDALNTTDERRAHQQNPNDNNTNNLNAIKTTEKYSNRNRPQTPNIAEGAGTITMDRAHSSAVCYSLSLAAAWALFAVVGLALFVTGSAIEIVASIRREGDLDAESSSTVLSSSWLDSQEERQRQDAADALFASIQQSIAVSSPGNGADGLRGSLPLRIETRFVRGNYSGDVRGGSVVVYQRPQQAASPSQDFENNTAVSAPIKSIDATLFSGGNNLPYSRVGRKYLEGRRNYLLGRRTSLRESMGCGGCAFLMHTRRKVSQKRMNLLPTR